MVPGFWVGANISIRVGLWNKRAAFRWFNSNLWGQAGASIGSSSPGAFGVMKRASLGVIQSSKLSTIRSEEHTSELQSLMRISYAVFCLKKKKTRKKQNYIIQYTHTKNQPLKRISSLISSK